MKKALSLFLAGLRVASLAACGNNADSQPATDENKTVADQSDMAAPQEIEEGTPVYADVLNDGTYDITVESSSSMFNIESCQLTVADGKMTAAMTMGGTGYLYVFPGTGEEAAAASEEQYISFEENDAGQHVLPSPWSTWTRAWTALRSARRRKCGMTAPWSSSLSLCPSRLGRKAP